MMDSAKKSGFQQMARKAATVDDLNDPLSLFAKEEASHKEEKTPTSNITNVSKNSVRNEYSLLESGKTLSSPSKSTISPVHGGNRPISSSISSSNQPTRTATTTAVTTNQTTPKPPVNNNVSSSTPSSAVSSSATASHDEPGVPLLSGEHKIISIKNAFIQVSLGNILPGVIYMTNYRYVFILEKHDMAHLSTVNPSLHSYLQIPLASIDRIEKQKRPKEGYDASGIGIIINSKDIRQHRLAIKIDASNTETDIDRALAVVSAYAFPNKMRYLFAFSHAIDGISANRAFYKYDPLLEGSRMGCLDSNLWRVTDINKDYKFCHSYPQMFFVPKGITDYELQLVGSFRSEHRIPIMSWYDHRNGASMWRSSQPKAGVSGSSSQDEKYLDTLARSTVARRRQAIIKGDSRQQLHAQAHSVHEPVLHIVDLRSRASAMANRAAGAGYESSTNYPTSRLEFYGIANIHAMRDSLKGLASILLNPASHPNNDINFTKQIEDTQWLTHIRTVLKTSCDTADLLSAGHPVLVHCSHGWDRTAQVCALAQMLVDPYYRTIDGFRILVDKEWCSYGHQFEIRCGHAQDRATRAEDQISPIFLQFLDALWQIYRQNVPYFEFNSRYILTIADHIYSGRFGNFLFGSDCDRNGHCSFEQCANLWEYLDHNKPVFVNPLCNPRYLDPLNPVSRLHPPVSQLLRNVTLWPDYFLRWASVPSMVVPVRAISKYLYKDGSCLPLRELVKSTASAEISSATISERSENGSQLTGSSDVAVTSAIVSENDAKVTAKTSQLLIDLSVPTMVSSEDLWEGAYRIERERRMNLEEKLNMQSTDVEIINPEAAAVKANAAESEEQQISEYAAYEISMLRQKIDSLVDLVRAKGAGVIGEDDLATALTGTFDWRGGGGGGSDEIEEGRGRDGSNGSLFSPTPMTSVRISGGDGQQGILLSTPGQPLPRKDIVTTGTNDDDLSDVMDGAARVTVHVIEGDDLESSINESYYDQKLHMQHDDEYEVVPPTAAAGAESNTVSLQTGDVSPMMDSVLTEDDSSSSFIV